MFPFFNRWDICEAYYLFAVDWHGGQFSKEYRIFGRLQKFFEPKRSLHGRKDLSNNGRAIYDQLVNRSVGYTQRAQDTG